MKGRIEETADGEALAEPVQINENLTAGARPDESGLRSLARRGFRSVMDLRLSGEEPDAPTAARQARILEDSNLGFRSIQIDTQRVSHEELQIFSQEIRRLAKPAFIHSGDGRLATTLALLHDSIESGLGTDLTVAKAENLGVAEQQPEILADLRRILGDRPRQQDSDVADGE